MLRRGQRLDYLSQTSEELTRKPRIALWQTNPPPSVMLPKKGYKPKQNWYASLDWASHPEGNTVGMQRDLSDWKFYPYAMSDAIRYGKLLNLPVVKHGTADTDMIILWAPRRRSTPEHRWAVRKIIKGRFALPRDVA